MKFLVLVSEDMTSLDVDDAIAELVHLTAQREVACSVKTSRDWFKESFRACGNLVSWVWDTVHRLDLETREPLFDVFYLPPNWRLDRHTCLLSLEVQRARRPLVTAQGAAFRTVTAIIGGEEPGTWDFTFEETT